MWVLFLSFPFAISLSHSLFPSPCCIKSCAALTCQASLSSSPLCPSEHCGKVTGLGRRTCRETLSLQLFRLQLPGLHVLHRSLFPPPSSLHRLISAETVLLLPTRFEYGEGLAQQPTDTEGNLSSEFLGYLSNFVGIATSGLLGCISKPRDMPCPWLEYVIATATQGMQPRFAVHQPCLDKPC